MKCKTRFVERKKIYFAMFLRKSSSLTCSEEDVNEQDANSTSNIVFNIPTSHRNRKNRGVLNSPRHVGKQSTPAL